MRMSPLMSAVSFVRLAMSGRLHFPRENHGASFTDDRGQRFTVFREVVVDPVDGRSDDAAVFIPHFHLARMSPRVNVWFSLLPIAFIVGLPGFRSKQWLVDETTGDFCGYYQWASTQDAEAYASSFAMRFMTRRALPSSLRWRIYSSEGAPPRPSHLVDAAPVPSP